MDRNKAIEVLKDFWSVYAVGTEIREAFETIIPELKMNEDERIRKAIKHLVNSTKELHFGIDNYDGVKWNDIIAWLEKQGEQILANSAKTCKDGQNPAWSEEDEELFGYLEDIVDFCYRNQYVVKVQTCEKVRQLVFRLKSLCFQSGWGKDDIIRINEIIETLNIVQANRVRTQRMHYNKATIDKDIAFLKSLKERYTWKPSDEQIKALDYVLLSYIGSWQPERQSLLNDLNKLKG